MTDRKQRPNYSPEVRERAVRMVAEQGREHASQWAAIVSISGKIGCTPQTLHTWVAQAERDSGKRTGPSAEEREQIKAIEREVKELRQANEILRKASAYFARAELDRRPKTRSHSLMIIKRLTGSSQFAEFRRLPRRPIMRRRRSGGAPNARRRASAGMRR